MLQEKTTGNLFEPEAKLVDDLLYELRVSHRQDAITAVLDQAVRAAGNDKPAAVWAQLQAMASADNPPPPLLRLDKYDILYRDADGDEASLSRQAVVDRLRRRRRSI